MAGEWIGNGVTAAGDQVALATDLAILDRGTLLAFVDYNYLYNQVRLDLDSNGRLLTFKDRLGNAFTPPIANTVATQFVEWTNGQYGLSLASNRGTFRSSASLIPSSGDWTLIALFTQGLATDGFPFADNDTSNWVSAGFLNTNQLRVGWGTTGTFDPAASTNDGNPCSLILSYDSVNGKVRTFLNNVEKDDRSKTGPGISDYKLMVGGRTNGASVTAVVEGTINCVALFEEAGDDGSAFITMLKEFGEGRAAQGWPT